MRCPLFGITQSIHDFDFGKQQLKVNVVEIGIELFRVGRVDKKRGQVTADQRFVIADRWKQRGRDIVGIEIAREIFEGLGFCHSLGKIANSSR